MARLSVAALTEAMGLRILRNGASGAWHEYSRAGGTCQWISAHTRMRTDPLFNPPCL
jgi:hypothetical protein